MVQAAILESEDLPSTLYKMDEPIVFHRLITYTCSSILILIEFQGFEITLIAYLGELFYPII